MQMVLYFSKNSFKRPNFEQKILKDIKTIFERKKKKKIKESNSYIVSLISQIRYYRI